MQWKREDISKQLSSFVSSEQFNNFELIMEDMAQQKFMEVQANPDTLSHAELIASRKMLNLYLNLARDLKFRLVALNKDQEARNQTKLEESERIND